MTSQEYDLNIWINLQVRVSNESVGLQKEIDGKVRVIQWVQEELTIPDKGTLDISRGYGEVEVFGLESINVEVM